MCSACDRPAEEVEAIDARRARIDKLNDEVLRITCQDSQKGYRLIKERIRLIEAEGISDTAELACCHYDAFQASIVTADWTSASTHAGLAYAYRALCQGGDSDDAKAMMRFCLRPKSHVAAFTAILSPKVNKPKICDGCGVEEGGGGGKAVKGKGTLKATKLLRCGGCGLAVYCGKACQTAHWKWHKDVCKSCKLVKSL
jgi:hypothetical protein